MTSKSEPKPTSADATGHADETLGVPFETSLGRLKDVVEKLESGELGLEQSLALFEEGVKLARAAQARLDSAEKRVEELIRIDEHGDPVVKEREPE